MGAGVWTMATSVDFAWVLGGRRAGHGDNAEILGWAEHELNFSVKHLPAGHWGVYKNDILMCEQLIDKRVSVEVPVAVGLTMGMNSTGLRNYVRIYVHVLAVCNVCIYIR